MPLTAGLFLGLVHRVTVRQLQDHRGRASRPPSVIGAAQPCDGRAGEPAAVAAERLHNHRVQGIRLVGLHGLVSVSRAAAGRGCRGQEEEECSSSRKNVGAAASGGSALTAPAAAATAIGGGSKLRRETGRAGGGGHPGARPAVLGHEVPVNLQRRAWQRLDARQHRAPSRPQRARRAHLLPGARQRASCARGRR